jgi:Pyruvate/2-oxoacid:ferredoxin oxidoreductase delta subunit
MDQGVITGSESEPRYVSDRQTGMFRQASPVNKAHVCLNCGYVEFYLDAEALKKIIKK